MPKMKTKSSCKKPVQISDGHRPDQAGQAGKRHGMIKRSNKFIRDARRNPPCCRRLMSHDHKPDDALRALKENR